MYRVFLRVGLFCLLGGFGVASLGGGKALGQESLSEGKSSLGFSASSFGLPSEAPVEEEKTTASFQALSSGYKEGQAFSLLLSLKHPKGWHSYYQNPGTVGLPVEVSLKPVAGFKVEGPYWSVPHQGKSGEDVYYGSATPSFLWRVTPQKNAPSTTTFQAEGSWQLCGAEGCMPPSDPERFEVSLSAQAEPVLKESQPAQDILETLPMAPFWKGWAFSASYGAEKLEISFVLPQEGDWAGKEVTKAHFFASQGLVFPLAVQELKAGTAKGSYTLVLARNLGQESLYPADEEWNEKAAQKAALSIQGILVLTLEGQERALLLEVPCSWGGSPSVQDAGLSAPPTIETLGAGVVASQGEEASSFWQILLGLFIGGFILNLMPCVFPVIGLKVMSFVQMGGGERRKVVAHSLTFVFGVLVSFWVITTLLVILKKSIPDINWAFWLENPWVMLALLLLMFTMALNMFGVFELGVSATSIGSDAQQKKGYAGSFYSGVLATVVATPCSAPFLGASMGPAMSLPTGGMYVAFTCMGLGMALPYLVLSLAPRLVNVLPRPGAWMESFKQGLSFLLFGTVAWLLWSYWAFFGEAEPLASLTLLLGLVVFALGGWIKGRWDLPYKSKRTQWIARIGVLCCLGLGLWMMKPPVSEEKGAESTASSLSEAPLVWEKWSLERQNQALAEGRPVYVDFTARWCATCQVNKSVAYNQEVRKMLREENVVLLKADKTTSSPAIDAELKRLGKTAVPVNVLYLPGDKVPHFTDVNLSSDYLLQFLQKYLH